MRQLRFWVLEQLEYLHPLRRVLQRMHHFCFFVCQLHRQLFLRQRCFRNLQFALLNQRIRQLEHHNLHGLSSDLFDLRDEQRHQIADLLLLRPIQFSPVLPSGRGLRECLSRRQVQGSQRLELQPVDLHDLLIELQHLSDHVGHLHFLRSAGRASGLPLLR